MKMRKYAFVSSGMVLKYMFDIILWNIAQGNLHTGATGKEYGNPSLIEGKALNYSSAPWEETIQSPESDATFLSEYRERLFCLEHQGDEGNSYVFVQEGEDRHNGRLYAVTNGSTDWTLLCKMYQRWYIPEKEISEASLFMKTIEKNELSTDWTNTRYFAMVCSIEDLSVLKGSGYDNEEIKFRCQRETGSMCWSDRYLKTYKTLKELLPE